MSASTRPHGAIAVPLRWRDLDHLGHVYHGTLLTLLDEARVTFLGDAIGFDRPDAYVVVHLEIDYVDELRRDAEQVLVTFSVERVGNTSITTREVVTVPDGTVVARTTVTSVQWDPLTHKPLPLSARQRDRGRGLASADVEDTVDSETTGADT